MPYSYVTYTGNGATTQFAVPFSYIRREHVFVNVNQVSTAYTYVNDSTVQLATAPANGTIVEIRRSTPASTALVDFVDGSTPVAVDFDTSNLQHLYLEQELLDNQGQTVSTDPATGLPTLANQRLTNVANPVNAQDAATKGYADANIASAAADAAAAAASAAAASASASTATSAASAASGSASAASGSASAASGSAAAASVSAIDAAASAASAAALLDNFDDRYLGPKTADPTLDNDGNALVSGALYFNTATSRMRVYSTIGGWIDASSAIVGVMATYEYVATAAQTTFSGADANGVALGYTAGTIIVSLNGAVLRPGDDYTATTGTSIVLTSGAALNDELQVMAFGNFVVANHYTKAEADGLFLTQANASATYGYTTTTTAVSKTLANRERCTVTAAGQTITLPASPTVGSEVAVTVVGAITNTIIARNGQNIMSLAENFTIDRADVTVTLYYVDSTRGWRII